MARAYEDFGERYDDLFDGGGAYDRQFLRDIAGIRREANQQMDDTAVRTIENLVGRVRRQGAGG
jgi:hypothetical protein